MTRPTTSTVGIVLVAVLALLILGASGAAAANGTNNTTLNETAPYYDNGTSVVNSSSWFEGYENVTLDSIVGMSTRVGPYVVGIGSPLPGGVGYSGPVVLGIVVAGIMLGAVSGTRIGTPGGAVVALVTTFGLISAGLAPPWLKVVVLMLVGGVAAVVVIRNTR